MTLRVVDIPFLRPPDVSFPRFSSWCIVIDDNVVVLNGKLHYESLHTLDFTHHAMI